MTDTRAWYQKKTTWGVLALFVAGGLEAIGVSGFLVGIQQIATVLGVPLTAYGLGDRLLKK